MSSEGQQPRAPRMRIVPYQARWPEEFRAIAETVRQGLGDLALRIDHIGSTAVPGLAGKDVIDVQILVAALDERVSAAMTALGYVQSGAMRRDHCPANVAEVEAEWTKLYFRPPPGQRRTNTHVRAQGRANQRFALLFRDYLRAHPAMAEAYGELKRRLMDNLADLESYPDVKDPACDLIYLAAEDWAAANGWQPGLSDA